MKDEQDEVIRGKLYQKKLIKVIKQWNRLQWSRFLMHLHNYFLAIHSTLLQTSHRAQLNLEGQWEVAILEIFYPSMYQNATDGKFLFFDKDF